MKKYQKFWLLGSLGMFIFPELVFSFVISFIADVLYIQSFTPLYEFIINPQFFADNTIYLFLILFVEFLGAFGLLIWNIKFNRTKYKFLFTIIIGLMVLLLSFIFYVGYAITHFDILM